MDKISTAVRTDRKPELPWLAALISISMIFIASACAQTPTSGSLPTSMAKERPTDMIPYEPKATQVPEETPPSPSNTKATRPVPTVPGSIIRVEPTPGTAVTGEVPASLLREILNDLAGRLKVEPEKIEIIKAVEVVWNNGSLGCPQPGEFYIQALVNGYWIVLEVDDVAYDYRASDRGYFFLCERPFPPALATSQP